jgi:SMC interacting uncharacterized protein involved in chromosome segregation
MITARTIRVESLSSIAETCPDIDEAFEKCLEKCLETVKDKTNLFRDVLEQWIERALEDEEEIDALKERIDELEKMLEDRQ